MTEQLHPTTTTPTPEPPRDTRWRWQGQGSGAPDPLHWTDKDEEGRPGWTWGASFFAFPWEEILKKTSMFPLEKEETKHHLTSGQSTVGSHLVASFDALQRLSIYNDIRGTGTVVSLDPESAAALRDFLNEHVITEEV